MSDVHIPLAWIVLTEHPFNTTYSELRQMTVYQLVLRYKRWQQLYCPEEMTEMYEKHSKAINNPPREFKSSAKYKMKFNPKSGAI